MKLNLTQTSNASRYVTTGRSFQGGLPIDAHKQDLSNRQMKTFASSVTQNKGNPIDAYFWLPRAAEAYDVSPNIRDYVIVPNVPIIISDVPNTNGVAFSREQLMKFNVKHGRVAFHTFKGKPCYVEHANTNPVEASGVILDVYVDKLDYGIGLIKVVELLAFDRNKNPQLASDILEKRRNCYSMGAYFQSFRMSDGSPATEAQLKRPLWCNARNELVYKLVEDIEGFETSSVGSPAFASATGDNVLTL